MQLTATWLSGPDSGGRHLIAEGTTVIGATGLRCDDPDLLPHHALLEVRGGHAWITQLSGTAPISVAGAPVSGRSPVATDAPVRVANSTLVLAPASGDAAVPPAAPPVAPVRVVRTARPAAPVHDTLATLGADHPTEHTGDEADAEPPPERERPGGLVPTLVGLGGSVVLAVATRRPMFVAFGAIGAAVACSSWLGQWIAFRRRHRREVAAHAMRRAHSAADRHARHEQLVAALRHIAPGVAHSLHVAHTPAGGLWARRASHGDAYLVAAGWRSDDPRRPTVVDLGTRARLAVCGPMARAVTRALVVQLVTQCGPADLRMVVATHHREQWTWLTDLPHLRGALGPMIVDPDDVSEVIADLTGTASHVVIVTDHHEHLAERTSALRRLLDGADTTHAMLAVLPHEREAPQVCTAVLTTDRHGTATWHTGLTQPHCAPTHITGVGTPAAARVAAALAMCTDPEDELGAVAALPTSADLQQLIAARSDGFGSTARSIAQHWTTAVDRHDPPLRTPLGVGLLGPLHLDLVADGPHALVAGTTGSGKSELLRSLVVGLATACSPQHLSFILVDYKGGATFDALARLPHVSGVVTDLDDQLAERMLRSLHAELRRREELLRAAGAADLTAYREAAHRSAGTQYPTMPRLVVIIDEFAALATERPGFLHALVGIAQRGRSLGVHLVLATQRPGGMVSDDIRGNATLRIALRLHEAADAIDVVGDRLPTTLPRSRPGRAVVRLGGDEPTVVQTARCTDVDVAVDNLIDATGMARLHLPVRPWLAPLPDVLSDDDLEPGAIGVLDDPDRQRRLPLRHSTGDGPLVVVGSRGAGVTSVLLSLAVRRSTDHSDRAIHVIDANGDTRWEALHRRGAAQLVPADSDGLVRLVHRLRTHPLSEATVIIDGIDELRTRLDTPAHDHRLEHRHETRLEQLVAALVACIGVGADVVMGAADPVLIPADLLRRSVRRWVMHLRDPQRAAALGMPASLVPGAVPGRVRVDAWLGQMGPPPEVDDHPGTTTRRPTWWFADPPDRVCTSLLSAPHRCEGRTAFAIGLHAVDNSEVIVTLDDGEHVMVLGPRGTGRTTTLATLAHALGSESPVAPVMVDDAERVDDLGGSLASAISSGRTSVVVAARGDALRQRPGHWTSAVRRSRIAIVLVAGTGDAAADGELLGVALPRRFPVTTRPGAAWLVDGSTPVPVRLAVMPATLPITEPAPRSTGTR
jgi:S-DNA-T family DNA segregation ATPase FtsK/SpoIIIE